MRKQELIHVHRLLVEVRRDLEERGEVPDGAFASYDEHAVSRVAIAAPKEAHLVAIEHLIDGMGDTLPAQERASRRPEPIDAPAGR